MYMNTAVEVKSHAKVKNRNMFAKTFCVVRGTFRVAKIRSIVKNNEIPSFVNFTATTASGVMISVSSLACCCRWSGGQRIPCPSLYQRVSAVVLPTTGSRTRRFNNSVRINGNTTSAMSAYHRLYRIPPVVAIPRGAWGINILPGHRVNWEHGCGTCTLNYRRCGTTILS
jgi:hypothetical protein